MEHAAFDFCDQGLAAACITGGAATGKTTALLTRARELAAGQGSVLFLCANAAAADVVRRQLAGTSVQVETPVSLSSAVLARAYGAGMTSRAHVLTRAEQRMFWEDVRTCGTKRRRLRELFAFLCNGWASFADDDPDWIKTTEEESVSNLVRDSLTFMGGVLPCEAPAMAFRLAQGCSPLQDVFAADHVIVDDFNCLSLASQSLALLLARKSVTVAADDAMALPVGDVYPNKQGLAGFLAAHPNAQLTHLTECHRPAAIVVALNAIRADEAFAGESGTGTLSRCSAAESPASPDASSPHSSVAECLSPDGTLSISMEDGVVPEFARIAALIREQEQRKADSRVFVAGVNRPWLVNVKRYLAQSGFTVDADKRGTGTLSRCSATKNPTSPEAPSPRSSVTECLSPNGQDPAYAKAIEALSRCEDSGVRAALWRVAVGAGDPLGRSVQVARLRELAMPAGLTLPEALDAFAAGTLAGASPDDPLLSGMRELYEQIQADIHAYAAQVECVQSKTGQEANDEATNASPDSLTIEVGEPLDAFAREYDLVIFGGFVNGFIPSAEYCDGSLVGGKRQRAHEADLQALACVLAAAKGRVVFTGFSSCGLETAEKLHLHVARIRVRDGVRVASIEPSDLLSYVSQ